MQELEHQLEHQHPSIHCMPMNGLQVCRLLEVLKFFLKGCGRGGGGRSSARWSVHVAQALVCLAISQSVDLRSSVSLYIVN